MAANTTCKEFLDSTRVEVSRYSRIPQLEKAKEDRQVERVGDTSCCGYEDVRDGPWAPQNCLCLLIYRKVPPAAKVYMITEDRARVLARVEAKVRARVGKDVRMLWLIGWRHLHLRYPDCLSIRLRPIR